MGFTPLHNNVAVERLDKAEKTAGGIIIPDTAQERPTEGRVVAAGPGARSKGGKTQKMDVKVGDRVVFSAYAGTETTIDGDELVIMTESDIMGIIE
ncbi:MAG: co-chaperone GroES [Rhodospirillaceae bacterium]|jgi:chaperonin GroES|nr:co-chaperone GroES [Rhodospirillaceae bacterium]MBT3885348.1 co-chaperone GroES [Rhodospirillaceae bacterium]MBT4117548.1 co-chaperone GroES [Rhodospirillaceae bacterium]MBT4671616.1 co-chaperone GroES [Rhodospirillaceae bacterium]MBT4717863.1 co-chaperone GroES [Rhodospirillaceae bacterium]